MNSKTLNIVFLSAVAFVFASCLHAAQPDQEQLLGLADTLTKLSAPVHTTVRYKNPASDLADRALLEAAVMHNPRLLSALDGFVLKARQDEAKNSSVLLCDEKGEIAYVEDAGCTSKLDELILNTHPNHPCDYVLDLTAICSLP